MRYEIHHDRLGSLGHYQASDLHAAIEAAAGRVGLRSSSGCWGVRIEHEAGNGSLLARLLRSEESKYVHVN